MRIDIRATPTERLREDEIKLFFTPSNKFETVKEQDTIYLMGPRGSGKSMMLNYLSTSVQLERYKSDSLIDYDENNLGIYIRCTEHYFGTVKEILDVNGNPTELWQKKFTHLFNLTACELILRDLDRMKQYPLIKVELIEEQNLCSEICNMIGIENQNTFFKLKNKIREEIRKHSTKISEDFQTTLTISSFLSELQSLLNNYIPTFKNHWLVILLDEFQELSYSQQQIISEIISIRKPIFKIATLPPEFVIERQEGKSLHLLSDFVTVDIGTRNLTSNFSDYNTIREFFKTMINKRLGTFGYDIDTFLESGSGIQSLKNENYSGLDNFVLLSSGNPRIFLKLLHTTVKEWNGIGNIPVDIQNTAVKKFASQLMDGIEYIPRISPYLFRSIILKIGLLFKNYLKETKRNYLQIGIKDPENLSEETLKLIFLAIEKNYLMAPSVERYSRGGFKLLSITLSNSILPYFDLPIKTHQVCELSSNEVEHLFDRRSIVSGTKILIDDLDVLHENITETLDPYLDVVQEIVEHVKNKELCVFVGSGLSTELGYPTGNALAKKIAHHFNIEYGGEDLSTISERVLGKRERGDLIKFVRKILHESKTKESSSYKKLSDFDLDEIYTTNWDNSIEDEFKKKHPNTEKIVMDDHITLAGNRKPLVYKLHGDFDHPNLFVITTNDSLNLEKTRSALVTSLKNSLLRKHFLFLGYSMEDLDFKTIFHLIKEIHGNLPLTSYAATIDGPEEKLEVLKAKGIIPLPIKGNKLIDAIHKGMTEE